MLIVLVFVGFVVGGLFLIGGGRNPSNEPRLQKQAISRPTELQQDLSIEV